MIYQGNTERRAESQWFADCCGATYSYNEPKNLQSSHKGIKVWDKAIGKEYIGSKQSLTHVKTKNGTITVSIRHTW